MELKAVKIEDQKIKSQIVKLATEDKEPIGDGIINYEQYLKSNLKILWLLKEPYDTENDGKGGWSMADLLGEADVYEKFFNQKKTRSKKTWYPIIYTSFGILNNYKCYDDIEFIDKDPTMVSVLKQIAFININKLASTSTTNMNKLRKLFQRNSEILKRQIDLYNPDIIIGCKTLDIYFNLLELGNAELQKSQAGTKYYVKNNKLYIDAYHPGQIGITRYKDANENYIDDLITIYRTVYNKK